MRQKHRVQIDNNFFQVTIKFYWQEIEQEQCKLCAGGKTEKKIFVRRFHIIKIEDMDNTVVHRRKRYIHDKAYLFLMDKIPCKIVCDKCLGEMNLIASDPVLLTKYKNEQAC
jgi:hypothetical protein